MKRSCVHLAGWLITALLLLGCAPTQVIPIHVEPQPVSIYLDGEKLEQPESSLELKANRDHTLYFKRDGYKPKLVILRTGKIEGKDTLTPERVALELEAVVVSRPGLQLEFEDEGEE